MKRDLIDSITFEFRRTCLDDPWVLFAKYHGAVYVCLFPFELQIDAAGYIAKVLSDYIGLGYLDDDWELIWSDSPTFVDGQTLMAVEKVMSKANDPLPM